MTQELTLPDPGKLYNTTNDGSPLGALGWIVLIALAVVGGISLVAAALGAGDVARGIGICTLVATALLVALVGRSALADRYRNRLRRLHAENYIEPIHIGIARERPVAVVEVPCECAHECGQAARQAA